MNKGRSGSGSLTTFSVASARAGVEGADDPAREDPDPVVAEARAIRIVPAEVPVGVRMIQIVRGTAFAKGRGIQTARATVFVEAPAHSVRASNPTTRTARHEILGEARIARGMVLAEAVAHSTGDLARMTRIVHPLI